MQQPPPLSVHQYNAQDEAHLKIISVCHYVMGGFYLLGIGFVILHFMLMSFVFQMAEKESNRTTATSTPLIVEASSSAPIEEATEGEITGGSPSELLGIPPSATAPALAPAPAAPSFATFPKEFMPILIIMYLGIGIFLVALCVCNVLSGHYIRKRKNRIFSFIIAGINCMQVPLGTALGVFTFIVLARESVKMAYSVNVRD